MEQNKTSKYLKYAIGEIILVAIGILIALSINNWNERRIEKINEINILEQLRLDLLDNLEEIEGLKRNLGVRIRFSDSIQVYSKEKSLHL